MGTPESQVQRQTAGPRPEHPGGFPAVEVRELTRLFGRVRALDGVTLTVARGEFFSLLGPSGCGKTTLLRILAGLDWPDAGSVRLGGRDALPFPPHRRAVNTVFQSYALFPHLTVRENIAFGLRMKRVAAPEIDRRVEATMVLAQIEELAQRHPSQLSGGQKQRVALARALVNEPGVLLLDEPLGALDLHLRRQLRVELKAVQRRLGITFMHVTHDQEEALALSDRLAVMNAGRVEQVGTPRAVYEHPRTRFVAEFLGACNLIQVARLIAFGGGGCQLDTGIGSLAVSPTPSLPERTPLTLAIRPERIGLSGRDSLRADGRWANRFVGTVRDSVYAGAETEYLVETGDQLLRARINSPPSGAPGWRAGDEVAIHLPPEALTVLED